jgi:hypothetical protein
VPIRHARLATVTGSGFVQRQGADNPTFAPCANDVIFQASPFALTAGKRTLAMLLMQLEDFGAGVNSFAIWRWPGQ